MTMIRRLESRISSITRVSGIDGPSQMMLVFSAWLAAVAIVPAIVGHGAVFPWPGTLLLGAALGLLVGLDFRVRYVQRLLALGERCRGQVKKVRVAGALTYVTVAFTEQHTVTLAYVTRNIDLSRLQPGSGVDMARRTGSPGHAVLLDVFS
jgi:hypothetical protein